MRSLVQAAREKREPKWREMDAVMERLGDAVAGGRPSALTTEEEAEVIRLSWDGLAPTAISEQLGIKKDTVRSVIRRAKRDGRGK